MTSDNKVVSDVKLQKIVDKLRASPLPRRSSPLDFLKNTPVF